jgi:hypothetical protein
MLSVEKCKKILGEDAEGRSDEAIELIRDDLYRIANLAFTHWQECCLSADVQPELTETSK